VLPPGEKADVLLAKAFSLREQIRVHVVFIQKDENYHPDVAFPISSCETVT
jgi:hypothetical protein